MWHIVLIPCRINDSVRTEAPYFTFLHFLIENWGRVQAILYKEQKRRKSAILYVISIKWLYWLLALRPKKVKIFNSSQMNVRYINESFIIFIEFWRVHYLYYSTLWKTWKRLDEKIFNIGFKIGGKQIHLESHTKFRTIRTCLLH